MSEELEQKTLLSEFQVMVEELRERGFTDVDVHSIVNMIWQGWLVRGQPTPEYLQMAQQALQQRTVQEVPEIFIAKKQNGDSLSYPRFQFKLRQSQSWPQRH